MKIDPHKHKERYFNWKKENSDGIKGICNADSDLILSYLNDLERGINIARGTAKGPRSFSRLNTQRQRLVYFSRKFKEVYKIESITQINEEQLVSFFSEMKVGIIKRDDGKIYKSVETYAKCFKAFWHWYQKINRKIGKEIQDITVDLDTKQEKPKWVYLNEEEVKRLWDNARYDYKVLFMFLFDTGIRAPTELVNIKVSDLYCDCKELNIRDEISKTFGRRIKLMICPELIKEYIKTNKLSKDDYLFNLKYFSANKYVKRLAVKLFGDGETEAGGKYSEISLYDFRHISCCYWLPRYKSESALKYRFGWKKSDKIHYYSELLGMKDTISEEDLLIDITKTEIEKRLEKSEKEKGMLQERVENMEGQMQQILSLLKAVGGKVRVFEV
ncbi:MAG: tyrosine-type recombinase/integrase [archaeon]